MCEVSAVRVRGPLSIMNYTYNALSHTFGDYTAYYDIVYDFIDDVSLSLADFTLVELEGYDVSDLAPEVRADMDSSFEDAFEMGHFDEALIATAYAWGFDPDQEDLFNG